MSFRDLSRRSNGSPTNCPQKQSIVSNRTDPYQRQSQHKSVQKMTHQQMINTSNQQHSIIDNRSDLGAATLRPSYNKESFNHHSRANAPNPDEVEFEHLQVQQREEEYAIQVMREREEELKDINRKMHVVNEIYKDLGEVVDQQQEQIDEIEDQFGNAAHDTERGLDQLERANKKHNNRQNDNSNEEQTEDPGLQKPGQYFSLDYLRRGATQAAGEIAAKISAAGKIVTLCGSGSASYVHGINLDGK